MDSLLQLVNVDPALLAKIFPIVLLVMGVLSGVSVILNAISKFTATDADDKAASFVGKIVEYGKKVVDFFSGNVKH